jgi:hypothetical protein
VIVTIHSGRSTARPLYPLLSTCTRSLERAEHLLRQYYTHELSHMITTIVERECRGCQTLDLSYRRHDCLDESAYYRVNRPYDTAWGQLGHQQLVDQWTSDCRDNDVYAEVSEVYYWKFHVGTSFRKRWATRHFHIAMQLMVENHIRLSELPSIKSRTAASSRMDASRHRHAAQPAPIVSFLPVVIDQAPTPPLAPTTTQASSEVVAECEKDTA